MRRFMIAVALIIGIGFITRPFMPKNTPSEISPPPSTLAKRLPSQRANAKTQKKKPSSPFPAQLQKKHSPECLSHWREVTEIDLSKPTEDPTLSAFTNGWQKCHRTPARLTKVLQDYQEACEQYQKALMGSTDKKEIRKKEYDCRFRLALYRIEITDMLTAHIPLNEINDKGTLLRKLVSRLRGEIPTSIEVAERLLEVDSMNYPAAKMALMSRLYELTPANSKHEDAKWMEIGVALERAKDVRGQPDLQLLETEMAINMMRAENIEKVREQAIQWTEEESMAGIGYYYLAWVEAFRGDLNLSTFYLRQSIRKQPDIPQFRITYRTLKKRSDRERLDDAFQGRLFYDMNVLNI